MNTIKGLQVGTADDIQNDIDNDDEDEPEKPLVSAVNYNRNETAGDDDDLEYIKLRDEIRRQIQ